MTAEKSYHDLVLELAREVKFNQQDEVHLEAEDEDLSVEDYSGIFSSNKLTKDDVLKKLGRKKRCNLLILKPFVDIMKYKTQTQKTTVLSISCNSGFWKMVYRNHKQVSRLLNLAQKVELIACVDEKHCFTKNQQFSRCKKYAWNKIVERHLLSLFRDYSLVYDRQVMSSHNLLQMTSIVDTFAKDPEKAKEYVEAKRRFNIRICDKTWLPLSDEIITNALVERYPQLMEMWKTIAEDNKTMPLDEWDYANIKMPRDKNGNVHKISLRKTNSFCSAKVHSVSEEDIKSGRLVRDKLIKEKFGGIYENDVKSSIYRITYLLNKGEWLDSSVDLYELIFGSPFKTKEERDLFKHPFCMQLYFNHSTRQMKHHIEYRKSATKMWNAEHDGFTLIEKARDNMFKAIGDSYGSEIFLHESCIYTQVAHRLREMGYRVIQIYDGFFTDSPLDSTAFDGIVKEEAVRYYQRYFCSEAEGMKADGKGGDCVMLNEEIDAEYWQARAIEELKYRAWLEEHPEEFNKMERSMA